jgi:UPF0042 nucleotide-binding protein
VDIVIVTGLSGAGRTSSLRALEDAGLHTVDNLPPSLFAALVSLARADAQRDPFDRRMGEGLAIGVDSRTMRDPAELIAAHDALVADGHHVEVLFLTAPEATLVRRFSETRRSHPLGELPGAIGREREWLRPIASLASHTIDTESLRARQLRQLISERYGGGGRITIRVISFGFKKGLPPEADLVFDARGLDNPHDVPELRARSGFHPEVEKFVIGQEEAQKLLDLFESHVRLQVPGSVREGRTHLTVAIGCTGGQHRSVALTRELSRRLGAGQPLASADVELMERHRDVDRSSDAG